MFSYTFLLSIITIVEQLLPATRGFFLCLSMMRPFHGAHSTPHSCVIAKAFVYWLTVGTHKRGERGWIGEQSPSTNLPEYEVKYHKGSKESTLLLNHHRIFHISSCTSAAAPAHKIKSSRSTGKLLDTPETCVGQVEGESSLSNKFANTLMKLHGCCVCLPSEGSPAVNRCSMGLRVPMKR